jgi:lipid-binding SYLF domain-containing protein
MQIKPLMLAAMLSVTGLGIVGCASTAPTNDVQAKNLDDSASTALAKMVRKDPSIQQTIDQSAGYAIFPNASSAGLLVGGKFARGEVYEKGQFIGYAKLEEGTIGAQIGGKTFNQLIVFQDAATLDRFKQNKWTPSANASAVILKAGAAASGAPFKDGVLTLVDVEGGAMAEASIGAQKFTFEPATK